MALRKIGKPVLLNFVVNKYVTGSQLNIIRIWSFPGYSSLPDRSNSEFNFLVVKKSEWKIILNYYESKMSGSNPDGCIFQKLKAYFYQPQKYYIWKPAEPAASNPNLNNSCL